MGGDLVARLIRDAMAARGLDRRGVVNLLGVTERKRSRWFQALDGLRAGQGASAAALRRFADVLDIDPIQLQAAVADDEGDELARYEAWERWAWQPAAPTELREHVARWYARRHPVPASTSREQAIRLAHELSARSGRWVWLDAFRSRIARLVVGPEGQEQRCFLGEAVPHEEAARFQLRRVSLRRG